MTQPDDKGDDQVTVTIEIDCFDILLKALYVSIFMMIFALAIDSVPWLRAIIFEDRKVNYGAVFFLSFLLFAIFAYVPARGVLNEIKKQHGRGK